MHKHSSIPVKAFFIVALLVITGIATEALAEEVNITESNMQFSEESVKIKSGDTLVFKNSDKVTHNIQVTNSSGATDDKGMQKPGETVAETLTAPGDYKVHCGIYQDMKLKVAVQ